MKRVNYLDGLRAMAITAVLAVHWVASQFPIAYGGYVGVDIFFVLSGYIITTIIWKQKVVRPIGALYLTFIRRRAVRLYPALLGFVAGTLLIYAFFPGAPISVGELVVPAILAVTQGYSFYAGSGSAIATPFAITWSLSVEWMFYLFWPVVLFWAKSRGLAASTLAKVSAGGAGVIYAIALFQDEHWFYYGPAARIPELLVGCVLALMLQRDKSAAVVGAPWRHSLAAISAVAFVGFYTVFGPVQWSPVFRFVGLPLTVLAACYLIWFGHRVPTSPLTTFLSWPPLTFIGRVSYSLYLWHMVGLNLFTTSNLGNVPLVAVAGISVILAVGMSLASYRLLEVPFLKSKTSRATQALVVENETAATLRP